MSPDAMTIRLHLRRLRVVRVPVDLVEALVVEVTDGRRVVRCPFCGFTTDRVHDRRRVRVHDLPTQGRPTTLEWIRRRFDCDNCEERFLEDHPEIDDGSPHPPHPPPRSSTGQGREGHVDPGGVAPLRAAVALPDEPDRRLVVLGEQASTAAPLTGPSPRRNEPATWPPVRHRPDQR